MNAEVFLDTNIVVYSFDAGDRIRHEQAKIRLSELYGRQACVAVSIQVLQEFFTVMMRKGADPAILREVLEYYMCRDVVENTCTLLRKAIDVQQHFQLSFYDANIVAAAQLSGAKELWTEDLNTGQDYGGVVAVNPFA
ncbi:MAG: PIN domain-containing protein [Verrucomicrobiota bacterium]|nr:PIN domain-containing protein [Verrucomicrobiota bacterium]